MIDGFSTRMTYQDVKPLDPLQGGITTSLGCQMVIASDNGSFAN
jgi:hypothetical protein